MRKANGVRIIVTGPGSRNIPSRDDAPGLVSPPFYEFSYIFALNRFPEGDIFVNCDRLTI